MNRFPTQITRKHISSIMGLSDVFTLHSEFNELINARSKGFSTKIKNANPRFLKTLIEIIINLKTLNRIGNHDKQIHLCEPLISYFKKRMLDLSVKRQSSLKISIVRIKLPVEKAEKIFIKNREATRKAIMIAYSVIFEQLALCVTNNISA